MFVKYHCATHWQYITISHPPIAPYSLRLMKYYCKNEINNQIKRKKVSNKSNLITSHKAYCMILSAHHIRYKFMWRHKSLAGSSTNHSVMFVLHFYSLSCSQTQFHIHGDCRYKRNRMALVMHRHSNSLLRVESNHIIKTNEMLYSTCSRNWMLI